MGYFRNSFLVTAAGLVLGAFLGWGMTHTWAGVFSTVFIVAVLAILEVSLSFDNAVVNAVVLKKMTPVWRRRFVTWGIAIAVFGMRIVFPLIIVAIITHIDPVSALVMAVTDPDRYSRVLTSAHVSVSAFGGAFLAMVGLKHFFNREKDVHWIGVIERPLTRLGRIEAVELGLVLLRALFGFHLACWARAARVSRRRYIRPGDLHCSGRRIGAAQSRVSGHRRGRSIRRGVVSLSRSARRQLSASTG